MWLRVTREHETMTSEESAVDHDQGDVRVCVCVRAGGRWHEVCVCVCRWKVA